ncbi:MAG: DUF4209 domain-containing protein [Spirochaetota bacterium]|nr:DUF4209 domain-containing protein [Spirochaetota bacterium]
MSINEEIRKFIDQVESVSGQISEYEISEKIKSYIKEKFEQSPPEILLWEQMAFAFTENYPNDKSGWGIYFGPMFVLPNKEGKMVEYPSIQKVTSDILSYWEKRAKESKHPILKQRYSNLVWDFSEKINGEKPHYSIAQFFVDSVIEIAEKDLYKYDVYVIKKFERALSLALTINDKKRIDRLKNAIVSYEEKIAEDEKPGLWGFSYELLLKNKKVKITQREEQKIIKDLEDRFERLLKGNDHFATKNAAMLLADYYNNKESYKVKNILLKYGNMVQRVAEQASPLVGVTWLQELNCIYLQYGLKEKANKLQIKIRGISKNIPSEMKRLEASVEIPKNEIEKFIDSLIEGDFKTACQKITIYYVPKKDYVTKQLEGLSHKFPIFFLFPHKIIDETGRAIAAVGSLQEDIDGNIVLQISQNMQFESLFLRETINKFIKKFNINDEVIVNYLYESPIFDERRKKFFAMGIEAYLNSQFVVALHILIPQIEALVRNLAEMIGLSVLKSSRSGGFNYRTLDELLRDEHINKVFGEDLSLFF